MYNEYIDTFLRKYVGREGIRKGMVNFFSINFFKKLNLIFFFLNE